MATIIKSGTQSASGQTLQVPAFNLADISDQASDYLQEIRRQAAHILEQAQQQAQLIRERAMLEGTQQARQVAVQEAQHDVKQQLETLLPALRQFVDELQQSRQQWIRQWENNVVHLAGAIAARMMRREARQNPEITSSLIHEALELAAGHGEITLHLNPDDYTALESDLERLRAELGNLAPTTIVPDPQVTPAGCRVQTQFGTIDQQIEAQLARIEAELTT